MNDQFEYYLCFDFSKYLSQLEPLSAYFANSFRLLSRYLSSTCLAAPGPPVAVHFGPVAPQFLLAVDVAVVLKARALITDLTWPTSICSFHGLLLMVTTSVATDMSLLNMTSQPFLVIFPTDSKFVRRSGTNKVLLKEMFFDSPNTSAVNIDFPWAVILVEPLFARFNFPDSDFISEKALSSLHR
jgi:hypothetical protein